MKGDAQNQLTQGLAWQLEVGDCKGHGQRMGLVADLLWDTFHARPQRHGIVHLCVSAQHYGHDNGVGHERLDALSVGQCDLEVRRGAAPPAAMEKPVDASASANSSGGSSEKERRSPGISWAGCCPS